MDYGEFTRRFREDQEIGRDVTDTHLLVYRDNGKEVGVWRHNRATTQGAGEVLGAEDAEAARHWCRRGDAGRTR